MKADKSGLESISQLDRAVYTEVSWNELMAVKERGVALLISEATQEQIDDMINQVRVAKESLVAEKTPENTDRDKVEETPKNTEEDN